MKEIKDLDVIKPKEEWDSFKNIKESADIFSNFIC